MKLLAIDSSTPILSIALCNGEDIFYTDTEPCMGHSELAIDLIDEQLKKAELPPCDLEGVLCMGGPGSFTGLRIGYSIAKGLSLSLSIPFAPIPTLDCFVFQVSEYSLSVIEARKGSYFYAFFNKNERLTSDKEASAIQITEEIKNILISETDKIIITGPGSESLYNSLHEDLKNNITLNYTNRGYAKELIGIAKTQDIFSKDCSAYLNCGPEYIRKTDAELNS